jgi:hypothetical protein
MTNATAVGVGLGTAAPPSFPMDGKPPCGLRVTKKAFKFNPGESGRVLRDANAIHVGTLRI